MKATKILAGMSAAAMAASMLTMISASADDEVTIKFSMTDGSYVDYATSTTVSSAAGTTGSFEVSGTMSSIANLGFIESDDSIYLTMDTVTVSDGSNSYDLVVGADLNTVGSYENGLGNIWNDQGKVDVIYATTDETTYLGYDATAGFIYFYVDGTATDIASLTYNFTIADGTVASTDSDSAEDSDSTDDTDSTDSTADDSTSDTVTETINLYSGEFYTGSREDVLYLSADDLNLYDYDFDGTYKLTITYQLDVTSTYSSVAEDTWNATLQAQYDVVDTFYDGGKDPSLDSAIVYLIDYYEGIGGNNTYDDDGNVVGAVATYDVDLMDFTDDQGEKIWSNIATSGLSIGGYNIVITSVDLTTQSEPTTSATDDTDDTTDSADVTVTTTTSDEALLESLDTDNAYVLSEDYTFNSDGNDIFLLSGESDYFSVEGPFTEDFDSLTEYTAFSMVLSYDTDAITALLSTGEDWLTGCIVLNSASTEWDQSLLWDIILDENGEPQFVLYTSKVTDDEGNTTYTLDEERYAGYTFVDNGDGTATLTVVYNDAIFEATGSEDEYAQIWFCDWSSDTSLVGATSLSLLTVAEEDDSSTAEDESSEEDEDADEDEDSSTAATSSAAATTTTTSDSNPATGAAALGGLGVLLAGAAIVVSKRK
ncbi:MAG: hypothetical protein LUI06_01905 [Ruminococcus sp.]|nr:hypothetical protein [Ruminococcus sp.]